MSEDANKGGLSLAPRGVGTLPMASRSTKHQVEHPAD